MKAIYCAIFAAALSAGLAADSASQPVPQATTQAGDKALAAGEYTVAEKDYLKSTDADATDLAAWRGLVTLWEREGLQDRADWAYDHIVKALPASKDAGYLVVRGWSAPAGTVAGYNLYMSEKEKSGFHKMNDAMITGLSLLVTGLKKGQTYYFVLTGFTTDTPPVESKPSTVFSMLCPKLRTVAHF